MKLFQMLLIFIFSITLSSCAKWWGGDQEESNPYKGMSAKALYTDSKKELDKKQYSNAISRLEALETMYPFNDYAQQATLDLIYAYYEKEDYPSAAATAERFIHLYPRAKHVDYAYYMKGLANFQQPRGPLTNVFPYEVAWRDPGTQSQAYSDFATLVQRYPNSRYKPNALQRMIYLRNQFAEHELKVAQYYFHRKMYVAAAERANYLIKTYQQAPSAKPALSIVYHANLALGLKQAAKEAMEVYQATFQNQPERVPESTA